MHDRALLKIEDEDMQLDGLKKIIAKELNVKSTEKLINSILEDLDKQKITNRQHIKNFINYKIYVNTIKNAYKEIIKTGINAEFEQDDNEDFIEIKVKIPKKSLN